MIISLLASLAMAQSQNLVVSPSSGGLTRTARVQVPDPADGGPYPIVISLHGGNSADASAAQAARWQGTRDRFPEVIYIFPGAYRASDPGVYANWFRYHDLSDGAYTPDVGGGPPRNPGGIAHIDLRFFEDLVRTAVATYNGDPTRVALTGFSGGGNTVYWIADEYGGGRDCHDASLIGPNCPDDVDNRGASSIYNCYAVSNMHHRTDQPLFTSERFHGAKWLLFLGLDDPNQSYPISSSGFYNSASTIVALQHGTASIGSVANWTNGLTFPRSSVVYNRADYISADALEVLNLYVMGQAGGPSVLHEWVDDVGDEILNRCGFCYDGQCGDTEAEE